MSRVLVVRKDWVAENNPPQAFIQYLEDWAVEETVLGLPCFVMSQHVINPYNYGRGWEKHTGVAPSHSVDLMRYKEGLPKNTSLSAWISKNVNGGNPAFFSYHSPEYSCPCASVD